MFSMAPAAGWHVLPPVVSLQWFACAVDPSHEFAFVPTEAQLLAAVAPEQVFASAPFLQVFAPALPPWQLLSPGPVPLPVQLFFEPPSQTFLPLPTHWFACQPLHVFALAEQVLVPCDESQTFLD